MKKFMSQLSMIINSYYYNRDSKNCKENRKDPKKSGWKKE